MKKILLLFLLIVSASLFYNSHAQSQFTGWVSSFNTFKTGKKISIHNDIQWRSTDGIKQMQTFLFRVGMNVHLKKNLIVTAGYAFTSNRRTISGINDYLPEHRIWEQLIVTHKLKNIFTTHRFRIEQRFISQKIAVNNQLENNGHVYANRFRYFFRNILPFKKQTSFQKGVFVALQDEVFVNFGNTAGVNGEFFDQNRFYVAAGYRISPKADIEIGYINQYVNGRGDAFTKNNIVQLASYLRL
ncbi:MAG: DUF2490 domain-containing protein [Chitinophagaceae bacterium]